MRRVQAPIILGLVAALLLGALGPALGQTALPPVQYVYDELNRLIAVIDRENNAAAYVYDGVGNILAIERSNVADIPGPVGITFVAPGKGKAGAKVMIYGKGFGTSAASTSVSFNGTAAVVQSLAGNRIETSVPAGATMGPITVTVPAGAATSPKSFRVLGPITVDPPSAQVPFGGAQQLTAREAGGSGAPSPRSGRSTAFAAAAPRSARSRPPASTRRHRSWAGPRT